jgi:sialate O-acetylesterase
MRVAIVSAVAALATLFATAHAEVKLGSPFSEHMVLQRDMPVHIWGHANPGEKITVTFQQQTRTTQAGDNGEWAVKLDPLQANKDGLPAQNFRINP